MFPEMFSGTKKQKQQLKQHLKKTKRANCFANKEKKNNTCYADDDLLKLRSMWNSKHPDAIIASKKAPIIWKALEKNLSNVCNNELCWLEKPFVNSDIGKRIKEASFAPMQPVSWKKNKNEWLTTIDIEKVMKQYEERYPHFEFLGPSPIDFDHKHGSGECVWDEICECDVCEKYNNNKRKLGFIFNLDPHYKGGSHWVSMFVDLDHNFIFFMDSNGESIPDEVRDLMKRIKKQAKEGLSKKLRFIDNAPMEHQYRNTECGIYCLYTLITLLEEKKKPQTIRRKRIPDEEMEKFRNIYFNQK